MRCILVAAFVVLTCASDTQLETHYNKLSALITKHARPLQSVFLEEVSANLAVKNPMLEIFQTMEAMAKDIEKEKRATMAKYHQTWLMCSTNMNSYKNEIQKQSTIMGDESTLANKENSKHTALWPEPHRLNASRAARNITCHTKELEIKALQAKRDQEHADYLKLEEAFTWALGNVSVIKRVLNGEGSLADFAAQGFLESETSCSANMRRLAKDSNVPVLSNMLQVFSKSFEKLEGVNGKDMDAINTILDKVRENLSKSLAIATKQENFMISQWQTEKLSRRQYINDLWDQTWKEFEKQGQVELTIGQHWSQEGHHRILNRRARKKRDRAQILLDFLEAKCKLEDDNFPITMAQYSSELTALTQAIHYMKMTVFSNSTYSSWKGNVMNIVSTVYKWQDETKPTYLKLSHPTYSTIADGYDGQSCKTAYENRGFKTVFTQIRILKAKDSGMSYVDPNDLTHSQNVLLSGNATINPVCDLFPSGLPLGRAASCSLNSKDAKAVIDLRGTQYKFGTAAKTMFQAMGRKTSGSTVKLSHSGQKLELHASGRCADVYGDDVGATGGDYRSDPIPLETVVSIGF